MIREVNDYLINDDHSDLSLKRNQRQKRNALRQSNHEQWSCRAAFLNLGGHNPLKGSELIFYGHQHKVEMY